MARYTVLYQKITSKIFQCIKIAISIYPSIDDQFFTRDLMNLSFH